jgi:signal transduction histidine kinase
MVFPDENGSKLQSNNAAKLSDYWISGRPHGAENPVKRVLNSVNISATLVADLIKNSKTAKVAKVAELLDRHASNLAAFMTQDEQGRKLPAYIALLSESLAGEQQHMQKHLASLRGNIDHIKEIVAKQQEYAQTSGVIETVPARELVEEALKMHAESCQQNAVPVAREYGEAPPIATDKYKVLQILLNLLNNAKHACDENGRNDKQITVRISKAGEDRVRIEIVDNGIGIPTENLTRIFAQGYATRQGGHGFGLHSSANAAKEVGAKLMVSSQGLGKGATFALEFQGTATVQK